MRFHVFHHFPSCHGRKITLVVATLLLAGCSSNTMRFTDGLFTNSTSSKHIDNRPVPQQPIPPAPPVVAQSSMIESRELSPIETTTQTPQAVQTAALGAPPRNLGTLPAHEVKPPIVREAYKETSKTNTNRYIVQSGDTLSRIAYRQGVSVTELRQANAIKGDTIRIGQSLTIPTASTQTAATTSIHTLPAEAQSVETSKPSETTLAKLPVSTETPATATVPTQSNKADNVKTTSMEKKVDEPQQVAVLTPDPGNAAALRWPAKGRILSSFGQREGTITNDGIDIMIPEGTAVKAAENGVVIYAGDGLKEFGNTILIRHEDNIVTVYGHNGKLLVQRGQKVRRGDEIAKSGKSGNAVTPKLHFEVRKNSTPVNPMKYLES